MREYKIGEIFKHNSEWYQCVEDSLNSCVNCCFYNGGNKKCSDEVGECSKGCRSDETSVIFKKLEKVGEKFLYKGKQMQSYIRATDGLICNWNNNLLLLEHGDNDIIDIEIKQTKEDMEEKKLNLKPFDLEAAKAGKPVCTRDGRKARIICFDAKRMHQPIIALITQYNGVEYIETYYSNGRFNDDINSQSDYDLMMLPEKKEEWVNIYEDMLMYASEEEAKMGIATERNYIATVKVEWEE